jgi:hypothetical protein
MDQAPLVIDEIDAGKAFIQRVHQSRPVTAACWLRTDDGSLRYLYVAMEGVTDENIRDAYGEVSRIAREMKDHYIDPFQVKIIKPSDPIAQAITDIYRRYPGRIPTSYGGSALGGVPVADVYIYPKPQSAP